MGVMATWLHYHIIAFGDVVQFFLRSILFLNTYDIHVLPPLFPRAMVFHALYLLFIDLCLGAICTAIV